MAVERHVRLFRIGRNRAVRIPRKLELRGDEAIIRKKGERLIIEAPRKPLLAVLAGLPTRGRLCTRRRPFPWTGRPVTMRFLLDTGIVSDLVRHPQGRVADRIAAIGEKRVCTSVIVAAELRYGAAKRASPRLSAQLEAVLGALDVLALEQPPDAVYGELRTRLGGAGSPIRGNEL